MQTTFTKASFRLLHYNGNIFGDSNDNNDYNVCYPY